jgi:hypothetical protein
MLEDADKCIVWHPAISDSFLKLRGLKQKNV